MLEAADPAPPAKPMKRWRPRLRFSLRTLAILMLFGGSAALLWIHWEPWRLQRSYQYKYLSDYERPELTDDGSKLVMHRDENTISVVDIASAEKRLYSAIDVRLLGNDRLVLFNRDNTLTVVNSGTGAIIFTLKDIHPLMGESFSSPELRRNMVEFSQDLRKIAVPDSGGAKIFSTDSGTLLMKAEGSRPVCFSGDSNRIVTSDYTNVFIQDVANGAVAIKFNCPKEWYFWSTSPDGKQLAINYKHSIHLIDFATCQERELSLISEDIQLIKFSPDSKLVAAECQHDELYTWNVAKGTMHFARIKSAFPEFRTDGKMSISEPWGGREFVTDLGDGVTRTLDSLLPLAKGESIWPEYIYPNDRVLSQKDGDVCVWDFKNRVRIGLLKNCNYRGSLNISPNGRHALTTDGLCTYLWSLEFGSVQEVGSRRDSEAADARDSGFTLWAPGERWVIRFWLDRDSVDVFKLHRPESHFGFLWLPECWLTALFAGAFAWSVWRDRRLRTPA